MPSSGRDQSDSAYLSAKERVDQVAAPEAKSAAAVDVKRSVSVKLLVGYLLLSMRAGKSKTIHAAPKVLKDCVNKGK